MGAVLHTLNIRLFPEQLAYVINHAEDKVIIVDASLVPLLARVCDQLTTVKHVIVAGDGDTGDLGRDPAPTRSCWRPRSRATTGPSSTNARPRPCVTPRAPPATPRAWSTATARRTCTRSPITSASSLGHQRARPGPVHRPHVPRQRLGHPLRRLHGRRRPDDAPAVPPGRPAGRHHRRAPADLSAGVPTIWNDLLRYARDQPGGHVVAADDHGRRGGGAPAADRGVRERARRRAGPGVGDDRDQPALRPGPAAPGHARPTRRSTGGPRRAGSCPASRSGWWPRTARSCPTTASRWASSRSAGRGSPAPTTGTRAPTGSTTAGCAPATSGTLDRRGFMQITRPDQGRHQVGRRVDLLGRAGERGDGPPRASSRRR